MHYLPKHKNSMTIQEACKRYLKAKAQYEEEIKKIQEEYASGVYSFRKGDVVIFKNFFYKEPTRCVIDTMHYLDPETMCKYRYGNFSNNIKVSGHLVDVDGYDTPFFKGGDQAVGVGFYSDDVIEVTSIQAKGRFR